MGEKRGRDVVPIAKRLQQSADLPFAAKAKTDDLEDQIKQLEAQLESSDSSSDEDDDEDDDEDSTPAILNLSVYQHEAVPALPAELLPKASCQSSNVSTHKSKAAPAAPAPKIVGKVPFACKPCGFVGKDLADFQQHKASAAHGAIAQVPLSCKLCSKDFTSADQLAEHKQGKWHLMRKRTKKEHFAPVRVCYDFLRGNCFRGDTCSFGHAETNAKKQKVEKPKRACAQFKAGACKFGDKCIFAHSN
ncbi:Aste57867_19419 [Aphanomyces stellatus]|uniref:Aste57867_19419 protein n=1 Tax=Aphanomyces stellatus TaxID=120398 RepID=A0A485LE69_9STRA|nr:hypothetical protein As57867_019355 [Aphanomyces stellatus]VFT96133.1 Aste57867_19419 [Aphanomyces stellatus]